MANMEDGEISFSVAAKQAAHVGDDGIIQVGN